MLAGFYLMEAAKEKATTFMAKTSRSLVLGSTVLVSGCVCMGAYLEGSPEIIITTTTFDDNNDDLFLDILII